MKNTLALLTVVYENYDILTDFFRSLNRQNNQNFHLYIADTSKNKKEIKLPEFAVTVLPVENLGYSHGVNEGLKQALKNKQQYFCVLNSDTTLENNFIENILTSLEKNPSSVIGGKIYYYPGYEYHNKYARKDIGRVFWYAGGIVDWNNVYTFHRGVDEVDNGQYSQFQETEFVTGCLCCFDKNVLNKVGFWDEKYFLYYEDADYCERAKKHGCKSFYDPSIVMWHKNAQSTGGSGSKLHQHYQTINRLRFGLKYAPWKTKFHLVKNHLFDSLSGKNK